MHLEINNAYPIPLRNCRVLAVIPPNNNLHITCCGINVSLEFDEEKEHPKTKKYITNIVSKAKTVKAWIVKDGNRIPVDIHDGNVGKCYFGYINPTIFD